MTEDEIKTAAINILDKVYGLPKDKWPHSLTDYVKLGLNGFPLNQEIDRLQKTIEWYEDKLGASKSECAAKDARIKELETQREEIISITYGDGSHQERIQAIKVALNIQP